MAYILTAYSHGLYSYGLYSYGSPCRMVRADASVTPELGSKNSSDLGGEVKKWTERAAKRAMLRMLSKSAVISGVHDPAPPPSMGAGSVVMWLWPYVVMACVGP